MRSNKKGLLLNGKILIIDDSPSDTLFLKKLMSTSSFEFDSVSSISAAEEYLKEEVPQAIILDYMLPDGDSLTIIDRFHSTSPILLLTGMEDPEIGLSAVKRGAQDFLTKGFINKDLLSKSLKYSIERQSLKNRVSSVEKMASLGRMSSGMAHEMNTPIQYIGDNLYFLEKECSGMIGKLNQIRTLLEDAEDSAFKDAVSQLMADVDLEFLESEIPDAVKQSLQGIEKISKLVKALKNYASNETSETKKLDINELIKESAGKYSASFANVLTINFIADENLNSIIAEERHLRQILESILENAAFELNRKFEKTQEKGEIFISTEQKDLSIEIRIKDSGDGVPEHILDHIFDPFFTTKSFNGGLGQGLAIVDRLVHEALQGTIKVLSDDGQGAEFIIYIPDQQLN